MEKEYSNCKRFESQTDPCPNRENEALTTLRNPFVEGVKINFHNNIFEAAKKICSKCSDFVQI